MQTIWFVIALVFLILSVAGLVTAAVLCFCRQRAATPRHPHNAHNAQTHPPVSFPCEFRKKRVPHSLAASLPPSFHPFLSRFLWPQPINHEIFRSVSRSPQRNGDFVAISNWKLKGQPPAFSRIFTLVRFCFCFFFLFHRLRDEELGGFGWETVCTMNKGSLISYNYNRIDKLILPREINFARVIIYKLNFLSFEIVK